MLALNDSFASKILFYYQSGENILAGFIVNFKYYVETNARLDTIKDILVWVDIIIAII